MKQQADKRRSERTFAVGDFVFLKLQSYVQSSIAPRAHQKLSFKYYGPYEVLDKIGSIAYKLKLHDSSSVHPVFHVSLLKLAPSSSPTVSLELPDFADALQVPESVLQRHHHHHGTHSVPQVLIKWSGMGPELATWEDADSIRQ